jgi:hypothetical protein
VAPWPRPSRRSRSTGVTFLAVAVVMVSILLAAGDFVDLWSGRARQAGVPAAVMVSALVVTAVVILVMPPLLIHHWTQAVPDVVQSNAALVGGSCSVGRTVNPNEPHWKNQPG